MKRKMVYVGISLAFGLLFASFLDSEYDFTVVAVIVFSSLFLKFPAKFKNLEIAVCVTVFSMGFFLYRAEENFVYDKIMTYAGKEVTFVGEITQISNYSDDMSSYRLKGKIDNEVSAEINYFGATNKSKYGDEVILQCTLSPIKNTYTFNMADYYKSEGIFLQTEDVKSCEVIENTKFSLVKTLYNYRDYICDCIMKELPFEEGNLICMMLFGNNAGKIDDNTRTALYRFGIGHVFSVSGFHLMVMSVMINFVLKKLGIGVKTSFVLISVSSILFVICSGFAVSAVRSAIMTITAFSSVIFARKNSSLNSLCVAFTIMVIFDPFIIRSPSFLLSVTGFYAIGVFAPYMTEKMNTDSKFQKIVKNFSVMLLMSLAIFPVSALFFEETSAVSALVNIIFTPIISFILILGMIFFITGGVITPLLHIASMLCSVTVYIAEYTASWQFVKIPLGFEFIKIIMPVLFLFVCITYAVYKNRQSVLISILISIVVVLSSVILNRYSSKDILTLSVFGENELIIIEHDGLTDIIDLSGGTKNPDKVVSYTQRYGICDINNIIICKKPYRSMAGYNEKMEYYDVKSVYLPYDTYVLDNICKCVPEYFSTENISAQYNNYSFSVENSVVTVKYGNFEIKSSEKVIVYKNGSEVMSDNFSENLTLKTDGISKCEVKVFVTV